MFQSGFTLLIFLSFSLSGFAQGTSEAKKQVNSSGEVRLSYTICKATSTVRTIRVTSKNGTCRTTYSKDGSEKVVASSKTVAICNEVLGKIQKNLEENKWACKDITSSRISSSY